MLFLFVQPFIRIHINYFCFFKEIASKDIDELPRQAALRQIVFRCKLTSRPRGVVYPWNLSRIVFRDLADHNKLSGVQRAMW